MGDSPSPTTREAERAFADAAEWYHQQLDREIPVDYADTARDYYENVRDWSTDTVEDRLLGYAPPDHRDRLLAYLHRRGHSRAAIQASGLFYEDDLYPHFNGRFVLPYFDADGRPVYAISRSLDEDSDGHPDDHHGNQKYTKAIKGKDYSQVDEPIYGLSSVDHDTDRLLVAGGIADAITLHEAGYACISPVTTVRFKNKHEARVAELVEEYDVDGVYIVNDAERPTVDASELDRTPDSIGEKLTIQGWGEGLRGAFGNVEFLHEAGVETYLAELPGGDDDLRKLDPDDYVKEGWGSVETLLAAAKPAREHRGYARWKETRHADTASRAHRTDSTDARDGEPATTDDGSALFDLDITDVTGLKAGSRGTNPLGHHGESEDYFVVGKDGETAKDWKYGESYNALTYLACEAGVRRAADPGGAFGDEELLETWGHAKDTGDITDDDPLPYSLLLGLAVKGGVVDGPEALVERAQDTGAVVEKPDEYDGDTYTGLPAGTYNDALEHVSEQVDVPLGREPVDASTGDPDGEREYRPDPREVGATVDPRRAWSAAGRVTPADLDEDSRHALDTGPSGETFTGPTGDSVGVVRAVALAEDLAGADEPLQGDAWREAYALAREEYDAPLPEYYTTADKIAEQQAVYDVIDEVTFWDLDTDALDSTVTEQGDEVGGDAVRALNPAWRESESGTSVLVYDSGTVWDADTELTLNAVRFVALDSGLIGDPQEKLEGGDYTEAYRRAREEYAAPLPRWEPADDGERHVTPQLPPAEDLLENGDLDGVDVDHLAAARDENENLIREAVADDGETPTVIKSVPATGKTTGVIKLAAGAVEDDDSDGDDTDDDEDGGTPLSYLAPRKQLQQQALDKADRWDADAVLLPVFSDQQLDEETLSRAVEHVREHGTGRLRDLWTIADAVLGDPETAPEALFADDENEDEDTVDLDRATCDTANGDHGTAWALAVHTARALGYTPREIHQHARGLFGAPVPCSCDGDHEHEGAGDPGQECEYTQGWEPVTDPDDPPDLLVGSYTHAHVESVRTHYSRRPGTGTILREPRPLVFDEYPGGAFETEYGEEATDFATWLAGCLREDVADAVDMHTRDLWGDEWVRAWLDGEGDEADSTVADAVRTLDRAESLLEAAEAARDVLDEQADDRLRGLSVYEPLSAVLDAPAEAFENLDSAVSRKPAGRRDPLLGYLESAVLDPLATATADGRAAPDADAVGVDDLPAAGDLRALVADALDRLREGRDGARAALSAASAALQGGEEGCRRLAAWATDGYAHPDAHHLLTAVAAPTGPDTDDAVGPRIDTDTWAFDGAATDGTVVDVVDTGDRARTVLDRNGHGAILDTPPSRVSSGGDPAPVVGLDATARRALWREVFHEAVSLADIHDTARERRQFLRETLDLRVLRAADKPRYYEGDPSTKDTVGDAALLRRLSDEYAGIEAPRTRDDDPTVVGRPAAITTKQVRDVLQNSDLVGDSVTAWENFGNLTGANDLGQHRLAAVLGCQHFGDDAVERFAALAGESVDTDRGGGRGGALEYGSHAADEYLAHMRDDQTMQAVLRFARGDSGATVLARTSALREDLPVVGEAQVVGTWSDTARRVAQRWRELGEPFTAADVADAVDVSLRHVRRVLGELADAGYLDREHTGPGRANVYHPVAQPGAGEVELPDRDDAVASSAGSTDDPGRDGFSIPYTWNVRVAPGEYDSRDGPRGRTGVIPGAPPAPRAAEAGPPDD